MGRVELKASRTPIFALLVAPWLALGAKVWWEDHGQDGSLPIWEWWLLSILLIPLLFGMMFALLPPRLVADADGLTWTQVGYHRRVAWTDIEAVGLARPGPILGRERIGIRWKAGRGPKRKDGEVAYRRSFTGYDVTYLNLFRLPTKDIVALLNEQKARGFGEPWPAGSEKGGPAGAAPYQLTA